MTCVSPLQSFSLLLLTCSSLTLHCPISITNNFRCYFLYYCDKLADRKNLRKDGLFGFIDSEGSVYHTCPYAVNHRADVKQKKGISNEARTRNTLQGHVFSELLPSTSLNLLLLPCTNHTVTL